MRRISTFVSQLAAFLVMTVFPSAVFAQVMPTPGPSAQEAATTPSASPTTGSQSLSQDEVDRILRQAEEASSRTVSLEGIRTTPKQKRSCRMHIFVVDRNGKILGQRSMPDAWTGSLDIALGKARTAAFFSSDENALSSRQIGELSQAHGPDGRSGAGPLWGIGHTNQGTGQSAGEVQRNCLVTFPGGVPLYKAGHLVGAIGVSGDGVDQDESVAYAGAQGFAPGESVGFITPLKPKPVDWIAPGQ